MFLLSDVMNVFIIIIIFLVLIITLFWGISNLISAFGGIVYVGSKPEIIREAFKLADLKGGDKFYELGSGLGKGLIIASKEFGAKATGIEISPFHYIISKLKTLKAKNIKIILANYKNINLSKADVIYCYLSPGLMKELLSKFSQELAFGARVVSSAFEIEGLKPIKTKIVNSKHIYLYKF